MDLFFKEYRRGGLTMPVALGWLLALSLLGGASIPLYGVEVVNTDSLGPAGRKAYELHTMFFSI